jgi:hypothetical protein
MRQSSISRKADCKKVPERRDDEVQKLPSTTSRVPHWASLISDGLNSGHHEDRVSRPREHKVAHRQIPQWGRADARDGEGSDGRATPTFWADGSRLVKIGILRNRGLFGSALSMSAILLNGDKFGAVAK